MSFIQGKMLNKKRSALLNDETCSPEYVTFKHLYSPPVTPQKYIKQKC